MAREPYRAESFLSEIAVSTDGSVQVRERVRVRFEGGPYTFFYRGLSERGSGKVDLLSASDSVQVRPRRRRLDVTWIFPQIRDTIRTFELRYLVEDAFAVASGRASLRRAVVPDPLPYAIDTAIVKIRIPEAARPVQLETRPRDVPIRWDPEGAQVGPVRVAPQAGFQIRLSLAADPALSPPGWQRSREARAARARRLLAAVAFLLAVSLSSILLLLQRTRIRRRETP
jgi:hypothetical protein